jgi:DNA polymerase III subunit epsilon
MRQIFLDTETTGLEAHLGHRIVEVACLEMIDRRVTKKNLHRYLNPQREIDAGAQNVHGLSLEFLSDKPLFADIADSLLAFIEGAELIIHNAPFDVGFLNAELTRINKPRIESICKITDTLKMARDLNPGKKSNLNALCERYEVDNTARTFHGALLDAQLLAEVYIAMTRGQESLSITHAGEGAGVAADGLQKYPRPTNLRVLAATPQELASHAVMLEGIGKSAAWLKNS